MLKAHGQPLAPITWPEELQTQSWDEYKDFFKKYPRDPDNEAVC